MLANILLTDEQPYVGFPEYVRQCEKLVADGFKSNENVAQIALRNAMGVIPHRTSCNTPPPIPNRHPSDTTSTPRRTWGFSVGDAQSGTPSRGRPVRVTPF